MILRNKELRFLLQDRERVKREGGEGRFEIESTYTEIIYVCLFINLTLQNNTNGFACYSTLATNYI